MSWPTPEETRDADVPAVEVALADGQSWGLALPGPRLHPTTLREVDAFGRTLARVEVEARTGYPLEVWRLWDDVRSANAGERAGWLDALRRMLAALLRLAHDVGPEEAEALLDPRWVDLVRVAREVIPAAFGEAGTPRTEGS